MVRLANPALLTLLAVEAESEVIGQPLTRFIAPGQVDNFVACLDNIIENPRQTSQMELTFKPLNRDFFPAKVNIGYFEWEGQPAVQLMIHDITEQKQTEAQLRQAKTEVVRAYDATLEGWSRALELRDEETEGHTQRVTRMTIQLAQAMGMNDEELVHVRRGALLHDIGKIGIPDGILLKPGPLTEEELAIMRKHPVYAYELLLPITYLHPALDIPYCHHEKWDGTGYPRGLKGTEIPLAARIFAVVDVWDALRSDRPYRTAWSAEKVLAHIREQAGQHFDPQVVDIFLEIMESQSAPHHLEKNR
jgi:PAS domain S-box-containing protein/putative nucleotidyltransferase with HDIG domain